MRLLIQRVKRAVLYIEGIKRAEIKKGLVVFLGISREDTEKDVDELVKKLPKYRIFEDERNKLNLSLDDVKGEVMAVSEFTLYGDLKKGLRPSFTRAMEPKKAEKLYNYFVEKLREKGISTQTGVFGAKMMVEIHNDGPVTFMVSTDD